MLIGITGKARSGKDTLANFIADKHSNVYLTHWADSLKDMLIGFFGCSYEDVYTGAGKARHNEFWGMTNRELLQTIGTDALRNGFRNDVWIKIMDLKLDKNQDKDIIIIPDTRFNNEAEYIRDKGGIVIEVVRGKNGELSNKELEHSSEKGIDKTLISYIVYNNEGLDNLKKQALNIYNKLKYKEQ